MPTDTAAADSAISTENRARRSRPTTRQTHGPAEKLFVDSAGDTPTPETRAKGRICRPSIPPEGATGVPSIEGLLMRPCRGVLRLLVPFPTASSHPACPAWHP